MTLFKIMNYKYLWIGLSCATFISFCFASWIIIFDWQQHERCVIRLVSYDYSLEWEVNNCQGGVECIAGPSCSSVLETFQDIYSLRDDGFSTDVPLQNITSFFMEQIPSTYQMCCSDMDTCQVEAVFVTRCKTSIILNEQRLPIPHNEIIPIELYQRETGGFRNNVIIPFLTSNWFCYSTREYLDYNKLKLFLGKAKLTPAFYAYVVIYSIAILAHVILLCYRCCFSK